MKVNIVHGEIAFYFVSVLQIFFFDIYSDSVVRLIYDRQTRNFHATENHDQCQRDFFSSSSEAGACSGVGMKQISRRQNTCCRYIRAEFKIPLTLQQYDDEKNDEDGSH